MMEPRTIENYIHCVFVFEFNNVGFICLVLFMYSYNVIM